MGRTPEYWVQHMGRERTIQAALRLHHDASLIMTNIQILSQLATSFSRAASEVMRTIHEREPFPTEAVDLVTPGRPVRLLTTWRRWASGVQRVPQCFRVRWQPRPAIRVWRVTIVSRTGENRTLRP